MKNFIKISLLVFGFVFAFTGYAVPASPIITSVTTASPATYDNGDTISFAVQFDQIVDVLGGSPDMKFRSPDNLSKSATYISGTGTDTLFFDYEVTSMVNLNDWDGIEVEDSSGNPANLVMNGATIQNSLLQDANVAVPVASFPGVKIDSKEPTWDKIEISSTAGTVSGTTRYLPGGSSVTTVSTLLENDTRLSASVGLSVGGGATQLINYTGSNTNGRDDDAQKSGSLTGDGVISLASQSWIDQAGKVATGIPTFLIDELGVTSYVMDSILPVISFLDDAETTPVASDDIIINVTDVNPDTATYEYGFSADAVCDAIDTFGLPFVDGVAITISDELSNGQYICAKATDFAGNIAYQISAFPLNIDATAPDFSSVGVVSNNTYDASYGKADSILTFTLTLTNPDSYDGNGDITFTIDGVPQTIPFVNPATSVSAGTYTATFDLSTYGTLVDNAVISVTGINFADFLGNTITNFAAGAPTPTVIVDTKVPALTSATASTNGNGGIWAKANQVATFSLGFDEDIIRGILNSASTANNISTLTKEFNISTWGVTDTIEFTVQNGDNGIITINNGDFTVLDHAGNSATITAGDINALIGVITADTTKPAASNITITSNNALDNKLAKTNDTIRVEFTTVDNLSTDITLRNTNPTASYILGSGHGFSSHNVAGIGAGQFVERFTDGTETSEVLTSFRFFIRDEAGNAKQYTQNNIVGANVQFDRTDPIVQEVKISATSADSTAFMGDVPTYYAKQGDTLDFELQVCDYVDSQNNPPTGTILGQAVTMTDAGQTGVACTTPEGNPSIWRKWTTQLTGVDGTEGLVVISIDTKDNAGNILVNVAGTTDGSSVIFDKTIPLNPTDVMDTLGAEILPFKHRSNAQFAWTNDADDTTNTLIVSGIQDYNVRLTNPANGTEIHRDERVNSRNFDGRTSTLTGGLIPPRDITDPYDLHIQTRDKAGNDAPEVITYTQPYTIGFVGRVIDESGNPISGAVVQVVSRYGETCDLNREVCTGITDGNGEYVVLAQKDQDYNLTFFNQRYYLDKQEENLGNTDNTIVNSTLKGLDSVHETQTANQGVEITTSELFVGEDGQNTATKIFVYSFSGEISHTVVDDNIVITSLSRITLVNSNNPAIQIINNGDNTYTIIGAGNVLKTNSVGNIEAGNGSVSAFGIPANYSSGSSRIGTRYIASNGNPKNTFGKYKTPTEWAEFGERLKNGVAPQVLTYINRNGFEVFRGYRHGILGWDRFEKRFQNDVSYRGSYDRKSGSLELVQNNEEVISFAEKIKVMKDSYQNDYETAEEKENDFLGSLEAFKPLKRVSPEDAYKGILARNAQKTANKWERKSSFGDRITKNPYERNLKVIKMRLPNGKSVRIERVMK